MVTPCARQEAKKDKPIVFLFDRKEASFKRLKELLETLGLAGSYHPAN